MEGCHAKSVPPTTGHQCMHRWSPPPDHLCTLDRLCLSQMVPLVIEGPSTSMHRWSVPPRPVVPIIQLILCSCMDGSLDTPKAPSISVSSTLNMHAFSFNYIICNMHAFSCIDVFLILLHSSRNPLISYRKLV